MIFYGLSIGIVLDGCGELGAHSSPVESPLIKRFVNGYTSPELFTRNNGINEFDLRWSGLQYFLYLHDYGTPEIKVRVAHTIADLATTKELDTAIKGLYPTVEYDEGAWHLWAWNPDNRITQHYVSNDGISGWVLQGDIGILDAADWHVRKLSSGLWLAGAKMLPSLHIRLFTALQASGPWIDQGEAFNAATRAPWYAQEEADPAPFEYQGKLYLLFAGWDGGIQRPGMVEPDPTTYKARSFAVPLVTPSEPWQISNQSPKLFNPVFLTNVDGSARIFYSHNPSADGVVAGWGYIEASDGERQR